MINAMVERDLLFFAQDFCGETPSTTRRATMMHVNPIASDGQYSIGYDANGLAGQWPGNVAETCKTVDWMPAIIDAEFTDGCEWWTAIEDVGQIVWQNPDGSVTPIRAILHAGGDL